jgi:signal transduction histidine kinase
VKDTGIGIPEESLVSVFERFVQADNRMERGYEGSGLGLSISKGYADILGGKIWCDSTLGKGTTFYFSVPVNESEKLVNR